MLHLTGNAGVGLRLRVVLQLSLECFYLLPGGFGTLLLGLRRPDFGNRPFDAFVGFGKQLFGLVLRVLNKLFPHFLQFVQFALIAGGDVVEVLIGLADALPFFFPVTLVAGNVAQVLFHIDILHARFGFGRFDDVFGQPHFIGQLKGKRTARRAGLQPEQRLYFLHVEQHRAVEKAIDRCGVVF